MGLNRSLGKKLFIDRPDHGTTVSILLWRMSRFPSTITDWTGLVEVMVTRNYSCADIISVLSEAQYRKQ
ncbi:hypothetical protein GJ744_010283 [Endocarpon pusillum]|uniref:Uncharacterized protein n=1 Tax=Endocarpon pusillum TaxID=364733 RepID=A0A8H7E498_9EURO|nr:hypothetical protein GJ744_010283 [Endocarpon pusillum]